MIKCIDLTITAIKLLAGIRELFETMESIKAVFWKPDPSAQVWSHSRSLTVVWLIRATDAKMQQSYSRQH